MVAVYYPPHILRLYAESVKLFRGRVRKTAATIWYCTPEPVSVSRVRRGRILLRHVIDWTGFSFLSSLGSTFSSETIPTTGDGSLPKAVLEISNILPPRPQTDNNIHSDADVRQRTFLHRHATRYFRFESNRQRKYTRLYTCANGNIVRTSTAHQLAASWLNWAILTLFRSPKHLNRVS